MALAGFSINLWASLGDKLDGEDSEYMVNSGVEPFGLDDFAKLNLGPTLSAAQNRS
jgi:hypothetical protein